MNEKCIIVTFITQHFKRNFSNNITLYHVLVLINTATDTKHRIHGIFNNALLNDLTHDFGEELNLLV